MGFFHSKRLRQSVALSLCLFFTVGLSACGHNQVLFFDQAQLQRIQRSPETPPPQSLTARDGKSYEIETGENVYLVVPNPGAFNPGKNHKTVATLIAFDFSLQDKVITAPNLEEELRLTGDEAMMLKRRDLSLRKKEAVIIGAVVLLVGVITLGIVSNIGNDSGSGSLFDNINSDDCFFPGPHGCTDDR